MSKLLIVLLSLLVATNSYPKATKLQFETRLYSVKRHPYMPDKSDLRGQTSVLWDVEYCDGLIFWRNEIAGQGDRSQYRYVYWEYELGLHFDAIEVGLYHKSEHLMDWNREDVRHPDKWPLEDSIFIRLNLLK